MFYYLFDSDEDLNRKSSMTSKTRKKDYYDFE